MKADINKLEGLKESPQSFVLVLGKEQRVVIVLDPDVTKEKIYLDDKVLFSYEDVKKEKRLNLNSRRGEPFVGLTLARKFIDHEKGYATLHREGFTEEQLSHFRKVSELFGIFLTRDKKFVEHSNSIYMEHIYDRESTQYVYYFGDNNRLMLVRDNSVIDPSPSSIYLDNELVYTLNKEKESCELSYLFREIPKITFNIDPNQLPNIDFLKEQLNKHKEFLFKRVNEGVYVQRFIGGSPNVIIY
jgi:hypothetical protein